MTFDFNTSPYQMAHGKAPRGYGSWAFNYYVNDTRKPNNSEPVWAPASTYAAAKKWMVAYVRNVAPEGWSGSITITPLS